MSNFIDKILCEALGDTMKGGSNDVTDLGNGYVVKIAKEGHGMKKHISMFIKHPNLFPEVKEYNDQKAIIKKLNTNKAFASYKALYHDVQEEMEDEETADNIAYNNHIDLDYLMMNPFVLKQINTPTAKKWSIFIQTIKKELGNIDFHIGNIAMDDKGQLKLIDW